MGMLRWLVGGLIGGAAGILIWVLVGYFTQYEIGWIAWLVGFLVGVGVRYAAYLGEQDESFLQGILAAGLAIGTIVAAKFILFSMLVGGGEVDALREVAEGIRYDDEAMVAALADEIVQERIDHGKKVDWPEGMTYDEATRQADYPADVWQQADRRWRQLPEEDREKQKAERMMLRGQLLGMTSRPDFGDFFTPWDLLWFGLATITAYKIGMGTYGGD